MKFLITFILSSLIHLSSIYSQEDFKQLQEEILQMKKRISNLESQKKARKTKKSTNNAFNPAIGVILNGKYSSFSLPSSHIKGFAYGHEAERGNQGVSLDHSEINFSSNIDDKFYGYLGFALVDGGHADSGHSHSTQQTAVELGKKSENEGDGHNHNHNLEMSVSSAKTEIELEEAYIQMLPNSYLPNGFNLKFGKAFWTLGYLNKNHTHTDTFVDRPLPYRFFLDNSFNDLGGEISYVLPFDFYAEFGVGLFQGEDFPFGGNKNRKGLNAWSTFMKIGGDISKSQSWQLGASLLSGKSKPKTDLEKNTISILVNEHMELQKSYHLPKLKNVRSVISQDAFGKIDGKFQPVGSLWLPVGASLLYGDKVGGRASNHGSLYFAGNTQLAVFDFKYTYAPNGNSKESELSLQGEYFIRSEDGIYEDTNTKNGLVSFKSRSYGWYKQISYKFLRTWQASVRYSVLLPPAVNQSFVSLAANHSLNENTKSYLVKDYKANLTWIEHKNLSLKFQNGKFTKPFLVIPGSLVGTSLDSQGHNPKSYSLNLSYMNSEFSKVSLQYNQEELSLGNRDSQVVFQYTMSLGAHSAHSY